MLGEEQIIADEAIKEMEPAVETSEETVESEAVESTETDEENAEM